MQEIMTLHQYRGVAVSGIDAEKFLQGQLTCDVTALSVGASTLTAHCDPKGKMTSIFRLYRRSEQQFLLIIRASLLPLALVQLKKYAVFSQVTFEEANFSLVGVLGEHKDLDTQEKISLTESAAILINPHSLLSETQSMEYWDLWEIQQGYPILTDKNQNEFLPQALNLQVLDKAISFQKGCYIGQEMVARAKYRGANKRAMFCFKTKTANKPEINSEIEVLVENGWRRTGTILTALTAGEYLWLQVVLNTPVDKDTSWRLQTGEALDLYLSPVYEGDKA